MKREAWQATVHRVTKSRIRLKRLNAHTCVNSNGRQNIFKHAGNNYLDIKEKSDPRDWKTFSSVQSFSHVQLFATPWITARQASLSITNSQSLLKLMSIESVMPSNHLILCCPLLLLPPIPPSIRVFSSESTLCMRWPNYWRSKLNGTKSPDIFFICILIKGTF